MIGGKRKDNVSYTGYRNESHRHKIAVIEGHIEGEPLWTVTDSINFMLYCFLGGLDFVAGPIVGAFLLVLAFELLGALQQYQALLYGVLMIAVMLFLPNGILSLGKLLRDRKEADR